MFTTTVGTLLIATAALLPTTTLTHTPTHQDNGLRVVAEAIVAGTSAATAAPLTACTDSVYALQGWQHTATFKWFYNPAGAPAKIAPTALATLQKGTNTVFTGQNRCGVAPKLAMTQAYQGSSAKLAQVSSAGACTGNDNVSVTSWGTLPATTLAYTCTYYRSNGSVVASDMLIDNKLHSFYTAKPANCANMWDLLAVIVHERGHTAGLAHVDQTAHAVATMSPRTLACDSSEVTLSMGDLAGLQKLYQH
jgi:matrixin